MASGRVGGTRSKLSGLLGDNIYQVVRNEDGTYLQIVMVKGEKTVETITPRSQAQRMVTAMVEALMRDLKPLATISMQSAANKSKSLNAFSSFNLRLVAQDCVAHWYDSTSFVYPDRDNKGQWTMKLGGKFMLSSGTCPFNSFESLFQTETPWRVLANYPYTDHFFYGLRWNIPGSLQTVGDFFKFYRITRLDSICFADFRDWWIYNEESEESDEYTQYDYMILKPNPAVAEDSPLSDENINRMFLVNTNMEAKIYYSRQHDFFVIGIDCDNYNRDEVVYYYGAFTISYLDGKKKISSSFFVVPDGSDKPYWDNHAPTQVFGSWMGEPNNHHYPSPFDNSNS